MEADQGTGSAGGIPHVLAVAVPKLTVPVWDSKLSNSWWDVQLSKGEDDKQVGPPCPCPLLEQLRSCSCRRA